MESDSRSLRQGDGTLEELMRERIRATIETPIRIGGGAGRRPLATGRLDSHRLPAWQARANADDESGATTIDLPRARIERADGGRSERHSRMIPRYQRRTERVDEAILGGVPERHQHPPLARRAASCRH